MKLKRSILRECARLALEQRGLTAEPVRGSGILPGARLRAKKGSLTLKVAVRTSLAREVGLTRKSDGHWATIPRMDEVLVAVPSANEHGSAEILSFAPKVLIRAFDAALKARQGGESRFQDQVANFYSTRQGRAWRRCKRTGAESEVAVDHISTADFGVSPSLFTERVGERIFRSGPTRVRGTPRF